MAFRTRPSAIVSEGALYEAVARGNKDTFFFRSDEFALTDPKVVSPFETRYAKSPPFVQELRRIPPTNGAEFGRSSEFEFETAGDLFTEPTILIDLPSWLPPAAAAINPTGTVTHGPTAYSAGYSAYIGYFLFEKIQLYHDKVLLYEFSGDALWASKIPRGSLTQSYVLNELAGGHNHSAAEVARNALPHRLRVRIPFPGSSPFPSIAMRNQTFRLRLLLRKLEDIVETSDAQESPAPWNAPYITVTPLGSAVGGPDTFQVAPLARTKIASPVLQLETRHFYTDQASSEALVNTPHELPLQTLYENTFSFGPFDYSSLLKQGAATASKRLDAVHPASRVLWIIRSKNDLRAGRRWRITPPDISGVVQTYYNSVGLYIAGREREAPAGPLLWENVVPHAKEDIDSGAGIGIMDWALGDLWGRPPGSDEVPEGSVNFTTADRPTLLINLAPAPPDTILGAPSTEMMVCVFSWAIFVVQENRGYLKYGN